MSSDYITAGMGESSSPWTECSVATVIHPVEVTRLATAEGMSPAAALPKSFHVVNSNAKERMARIVEVARLSRDHRNSLLSPGASLMTIAPNAGRTEP
jgi:hypothetical protein